MHSSWRPAQDLTTAPLHAHPGMNLYIFLISLQSLRQNCHIQSSSPPLLETPCNFVKARSQEFVKTDSRADPCPGHPIPTHATLCPDFIACLRPLGLFPHLYEAPPGPNRSRIHTHFPRPSPCPTLVGSTGVDESEAICPLAGSGVGSQGSGGRI